MMERNIRDVRDIFVRTLGESAQKSKQQELRSYDYSPRSRRRHEAMENYDKRMPIHNPDIRSSHSNTNKKINRHQLEDSVEPSNRSSKKQDVETQLKNAASKNKDAAYYANRTLTERDIRHLERHLSMKKTIRKQISRNLHQAFVDDPDLVLNDASGPVHKALNKTSQDKSFTLTRAKVSKSEQNVLDLLKDNEPDSGHCSADNPNSSDDDTHQEKPIKPCNSRPVHETRSKVEVNYKDDGKFSFWKMFSVKNRGKR